MEIKSIADINQYVGISINPLNTPDTVYELYSVPSFDLQYPEIIKGSDIGSTKMTVEEGDVLICKINPRINRVWVVKRHTNYTLLASSEWIVVRNRELDSNYLKWYFLSPPFRQLMVSQVAGIGGSLTRAQPKQVAKYLVPLPTFDEQRQISTVLDKLTDLIFLRKQQLAKLDEAVKSEFIELFIGKGYSTKTVDEVSLGKGEYGAQSASVEYDPARPRYVRITDINDDGTLNDDIVASINPDDDEQYRLEYGDFLFARMGATVGKTYAFITGKQIFAGYLIRYKLNQKLINPRYLFWYTKLGEYWNWVKLNQSGAAQPGINAKKYGLLRVPVPPIELQQQFATFVEQTDKSKLTIQQSLDKLEVLKKSLMQQYFG